MRDVVLLLSESHPIINDLDVILHGFMLQIIYTTVFPELNNLTLHVQLFNSENRDTNIAYTTLWNRKILWTLGFINW
jgi:hypothetical protein